MTWYTKPLRDCLPADFVDLFLNDNEGERVIFIGVGVVKDIQDAFGFSVGRRFVDAQYMYDGLVRLGVLCFFNDNRPKSGLAAIQLSLWGWKRCTKSFFPKGTRSWEKMVAAGPEFCPPSWGMDNKGKVMVPFTRTGFSTYNYNNKKKGSLSVHQVVYHGYEVYCPASLFLIKMKATLLVNTKYDMGKMDRTFIMQILEDDIGHDFTP